jgi:hypothetical protein
MFEPSAALGGHGRKMRNSPRSSNNECDLGSPGGKSGQFMPSMGAKIGSLPWVSCQRCWIMSTDSDMAFAGW